MVIFMTQSKFILEVWRARVKTMKSVRQATLSIASDYAMPVQDVWALLKAEVK